MSSLTEPILAYLNLASDADLHNVLATALGEANAAAIPLNEARGVLQSTPLRDLTVVFEAFFPEGDVFAAVVESLKRTGNDQSWKDTVEEEARAQAAELALAEELFPPDEVWGRPKPLQRPSTYIDLSNIPDSPPSENRTTDGNAKVGKTASAAVDLRSSSPPPLIPSVPQQSQAGSSTISRERPRGAATNSSRSIDQATHEAATSVLQSTASSTRSTATPSSRKFGRRAAPTPTGASQNLRQSATAPNLAPAKASSADSSAPSSVSASSKAPASTSQVAPASAPAQASASTSAIRPAQAAAMLQQARSSAAASTSQQASSSSNNSVETPQDDRLDQSFFFVAGNTSDSPSEPTAAELAKIDLSDFRFSVKSHRVAKRAPGALYQDWELHLSQVNYASDRAGLISHSTTFGGKKAINPAMRISLDRKVTKPEAADCGKLWEKELRKACVQYGKANVMVKTDAAKQRRQNALDVALAKKFDPTLFTHQRVTIRTVGKNRQAGALAITYRAGVIVEIPAPRLYKSDLSSNPPLVTPANGRKTALIVFPQQAEWLQSASPESGSAAEYTALLNALQSICQAFVNTQPVSGNDMVRTFNHTMGRYRDFLYGRPVGYYYQTTGLLKNHVLLLLKTQKGQFDVKEAQQYRLPNSQFHLANNQTGNFGVPFLAIPHFPTLSNQQFYQLVQKMQVDCEDLLQTGPLSVMVLVMRSLVASIAKHGIDPEAYDGGLFDPCTLSEIDSILHQCSKCLKKFFCSETICLNGVITCLPCVEESKKHTKHTPRADIASLRSALPHLPSAFRNAISRQITTAKRFAPPVSTPTQIATSLKSRQVLIGTLVDSVLHQPVANLDNANELLRYQVRKNGKIHLVKHNNQLRVVGLAQEMLTVDLAGIGRLSGSFFAGVKLVALQLIIAKQIPIQLAKVKHDHATIQEIKTGVADLRLSAARLFHLYGKADQDIPYRTADRARTGVPVVKKMGEVDRRLQEELLPAEHRQMSDTAREPATIPLHAESDKRHSSVSAEKFPELLAHIYEEVARREGKKVVRSKKDPSLPVPEGEYWEDFTWPALRTFLKERVSTNAALCDKKNGVDSTACPESYLLVILLSEGLDHITKAPFVMERRYPNSLSMAHAYQHTRTAYTGFKVWPPASSQDYVAAVRNMIAEWWITNLCRGSSSGNDFAEFVQLLWIDCKQKDWSLFKNFTWHSALSLAFKDIDVIIAATDVWDTACLV